MSRIVVDRSRSVWLAGWLAIDRSIDRWNKGKIHRFLCCLLALTSHMDALIARACSLDTIVKFRPYHPKLLVYSWHVAQACNFGRPKSIEEHARTYIVCTCTVSIYFYESILQDKSTHVIFTFPNSTT
jgi:hypothetical protein